MAKANKEAVESDYTAYVDRPASTMQAHFLDWLLEKTEYDPATAKTKAAAFEAGVRLGTALRGAHQASPENQERLALARKAAEEAVEKAATKPAKAAAPAKAVKPAKAIKPAPVVEPDEDDDDDDDEEVETPAAPPVKRAAKKATPTAARRGRPAAQTDEEAPF